MSDQPRPLTRPQGSQPSKKRTVIAGQASAELADKPPVEPTLKAYFGPMQVNAGAFVKAAKIAKLARFSDEDIATGAALALEFDSNGARLLALATQPGMPKAIQNWIWPAVGAIVRAKLPAAFEPLDYDADITFQRILRIISTSLSDLDVKRRHDAEILLLLSLSWLGTQRSLNVVATLEALRDTFPETDASMRAAVLKTLVGGKVSELKRATAVATLIGRTLQEVRGSLEAERHRRVAIEERLVAAKAKGAELAALVDALTKERDHLVNEIDAANRRLNESQLHAGHDIVELRAQQVSLLQKRLAPLLSDAVDALEITPPEPGIALKRIKSAISTIEGSPQ